MLLCTVLVILYTYISYAKDFDIYTRFHHPMSKDCGNTGDTPSDILQKVNPRTCFVRDKWKDLKAFVRPTQPDIGYAWAIRKWKKDFSSKSEAQKEMNPSWSTKWPLLDADDFNNSLNTIPCVIGPQENGNELKFYVVDSHHTLSALDYSTYDDTYVYIDIVDDYRVLDYDLFVDKMKAGQYTHLLSNHGGKRDLPREIEFSKLPKVFNFNDAEKTLGDNPWRSLAAYTRKVKKAPDRFPRCDTNAGDSKNCMRAFERICDDDGFGINFFEFIWAYFYVDANYFNVTVHWSSNDEWNSFKTSYDALIQKYYDKNGEWIDSEKYSKISSIWTETASLLVPLSRENSTGTYIVLPHFGRGALPGHTKGYTKLIDDPKCNGPLQNAQLYKAHDIIMHQYDYDYDYNWKEWIIMNILVSTVTTLFIIGLCLWIYYLFLRMCSTRNSIKT